MPLTGEEISRWYGVLLAAIFCYLQLIGQGGGVLGEALVHSHRSVSMYFSISLIALTAGMKLPSSKLFKLSLFSVIIACATLLSATVPNKFWWVPYISCIRPLFDMLLPKPLQDRIHRLCHPILNGAWNETNQCVQRALAAIQGFADQCVERAIAAIQRWFLPVDTSISAPPPSSSSSQANLGCEVMSVGPLGFRVVV